jgi:hypothetical protein
MPAKPEAARRWATSPSDVVSVTPRWMVSSAQAPRRWATSPSDVVNVVARWMVLSAEAPRRWAVSTFDVVNVVARWMVLSAEAPRQWATSPSDIVIVCVCVWGGGEPLYQHGYWCYVDQHNANTSQAYPILGGQSFAPARIVGFCPSECPPRHIHRWAQIELQPYSEGCAPFLGGD